MRANSEVALLHFTAPPVVGGVEQVMGWHARLLADAGHAVRIVAGRGAPPDPRIAFVTVPRADTSHPDVVGLQAELDVGRVPDAFPRLVAELEGELAVALAGADVVIAHNIGSFGRNLALTAALRERVGRGNGPRTILWHHDLSWTLAPYRRTLHDGRPWDLLRTAWPGVTNVTVSQPRRADLAALLGVDPAGVRVVPNGVDLAALLGLAPRTVGVIRANGLLGFDPLVLQPARITPRKNIELALRVISALRAAGRPSAGVVVTGPIDPHDAGARTYFETLTRLRRELELEGSAVFLAEALEDPADEALVGDLFRIADLMLFPSLDEGFGIPILEAGAHRLPIVCSDLPSLRDLAGDAATYTSPTAEPAAVAALVTELLARDPRTAFARRVRTDFTWEAVYRRDIAPLLAEA